MEIRVVHDFSSLGVVLEAIMAKMLAIASGKVQAFELAHDAAASLPAAAPASAQDASTPSGPPPDLAPKRRRGRPSKEETVAAASQPVLFPAPAAQPSAAVAAAPPTIPTVAAVPTAQVADKVAAAVSAVQPANNTPPNADQIAEFREWVTTTFIVTPGCGEEMYTEIRAKHGNLTLHTAPLGAVNAFRKDLEAHFAQATGAAPVAGKKSPAGF